MNIFFFAVLPLFVHITSERNALSADRVYDLHCSTFGSRPSALVTWWLGTTQLLDHSSQVKIMLVYHTRLYFMGHHSFDNCHKMSLIFSKDQADFCLSRKQS